MLNSGETYLSIPSHCFIPYAIHYDENTILTKNGELIQCIKISTFLLKNSETLSNKDLRDLIRGILKDYLATGYAVWVHTARFKKNATTLWIKDNNYFSQQLHQSRYQDNAEGVIEYANELYISIVSNNLREKLDLTSLFQPLCFRHVHAKYQNFFNNTLHTLNSLTQNLLEKLDSFGAHRLGIIEKKDGYVSELLSFFNFLLTLQYRDVYLSCQSISQCLLHEYRVAMGFNSLQIVSYDKKVFAAILSIKRSIYTPADDDLDECLDINYPFIITEFIEYHSFDEKNGYIDRQNAFIALERNRALEDCLKATPEDKFCKQQLNIMLFHENIHALHFAVATMYDKLTNLNLMVIRNDLLLEDSYWMQLPGNFAFIKYKKTTLLRDTFNFALLCTSYRGKLSDTYWQKASTIFSSVHNYSYFFSFHYYDTWGHTSIIGSADTGKSSLLNCILSETCNLGIKIIMLESSGKSEVFINALGGRYTTLTTLDDVYSLCINPVTLRDTKKNRAILARYLLTVSKSTSKIFLDSVVNRIFALPIEERKLPKLQAIFKTVNTQDDSWYKRKSITDLFNEQVKIPLDLPYFGLNLSACDKLLNSTILYYLLSYLERQMLDGERAVLVIDNPDYIASLYNSETALENWLQHMQNLNTVVVFLIDDISDSVKNSNFITYIHNKTTTQIFLPSTNITKENFTDFGVSPRDQEIILNLSVHTRNFFIKQGKKSVLLQLDLSKLKEKEVLSCNPRTVKYMQEAIREVGNEPSKWLPLFYKKFA